MVEVNLDRIIRTNLIPEDVVDRFYNGFEISFITGCWNWKKAISDKGYGELRSTRIRSGKHTRAHQISWMIYNGNIPDGLMVCHKRDNPRCVNPDHLFLGTHLENTQDKMNKGRWKSRYLYGTEHPQHGTKHHSNKLSENDVREIRRIYAEGVTIRAIASRFGIVHGTVNSIVQGRKWSWLK